VGLYTLFHPGLRKGNGSERDEAADDSRALEEAEDRHSAEVVPFP
jgi:hypothetical protein